MDELIAELEKAAEGSRELDKKIALHVLGPPKPLQAWKHYQDRANPPNFSTNLDVVRRKLVLEGVTWSIGSSGVCHVGTEHGKGKTPELGFVIAALKARRATLSPAR